MVEPRPIVKARLEDAAGVDISAANPLPVDISPGAKIATTILDLAAILATVTTTLADCTAQGTHTGAADPTIMTDAAAHFVADELIGLTIQNTTDGSAGVVIANTETTVTVAALAGGATNSWNTDDAYSIVGFALNMTLGKETLALTVKARYDVAATRGIRVHVITSPINSATGTHPGAPNPLVMTDPTAHFIVNELVGLTINNVTDGSAGVITANTELTVTVAALLGGATNQWNPDDAYAIPGADFDTEDFDAWNPAFAADAVLRQTKIYDTDPMYIKVLVENLDPIVAVTDVLVIAGV